MNIGNSARSPVLTRKFFPQLRFERPDEKDDSNPYVCFRRRDVRQPRKTRRIDILNSQKLRLLHQELQHAKEMALLVARREQVTLEMLDQNMHIFDKRAAVKRVKRTLNIRGEDDDLVNHKRKHVNVVAQSQMRQSAIATESNNIIASDSSVKKGLKGKIFKKKLRTTCKIGPKSLRSNNYRICKPKNWLLLLESMQSICMHNK